MNHPVAVANTVAESYLNGNFDEVRQALADCSPMEAAALGLLVSEFLTRTDRDLWRGHLIAWCDDE